MASGQWGRTMVTIDGCKLLVDHGEAQGVGVTKLSEGKRVEIGCCDNSEAETGFDRDSTCNRPGPRFDPHRPNRPVWPNGGSPWALA